MIKFQCGVYMKMNLTASLKIQSNTVADQWQLKCCLADENLNRSWCSQDVDVSTCMSAAQQDEERLCRTRTAQVFHYPGDANKLRWFSSYKSEDRRWLLPRRCRASPCAVALVLACALCLPCERRKQHLEGFCWGLWSFEGGLSMQ